MFKKLSEFTEKFIPKTFPSECIQVIVYCTKSNLSADDLSRKISEVSKRSSDKASEKNLDHWYDNNQSQQILRCSDFSDMEDIFEEAEYGGLPTSSIYDNNNDIMLIAIGPDKSERISKLIDELEKF